MVPGVNVVRPLPEYWKRVLQGNELLLYLSGKERALEILRAAISLRRESLVIINGH